MLPSTSRSTKRSVATRLVVAASLLSALTAGAVLLRTRAAKHAGGDVPRDVPRLEGSTVVFSPAYRERAAIGFVKAERLPFKPIVRVVGTVGFNPSYVAAIGTRLRGTVRRTFKYEGDRVAANEPLAEVESAELGEAQATIAQSQATQSAAELHARREQGLLDKGLTTAREAEMANTALLTAAASLKAAEQRVNSFGGNGAFGVFILKSPIGGHVVERHLAPGQSVDGNVVGYKVADLDHLWIELSVFERDLGSVHVNDEVEVTSMAEPGQKITGIVAHVGEVIHPTTRSTDVRVTVDRPKHHLRVGQSVHATITSGKIDREALLVPHSAVLYVDGKPTVFVADVPPGADAAAITRVKAVTVRLGASDGTRHEVTEGVEAGQQVASSGVFALKSELFR